MISLHLNKILMAAILNLSLFRAKMTTASQNVIEICVIPLFYMIYTDQQLQMHV